MGISHFLFIIIQKTIMYSLNKGYWRILLLIKPDAQGMVVVPRWEFLRRQIWLTFTAVGYEKSQEE